MTRTQIVNADFSCGGMQKGTNGDESDTVVRRETAHWKQLIDNRHKHTIIATLSVKKGSKFTDPDAQFPRGGALACARGLSSSSLYLIHSVTLKFNTNYKSWLACEKIHVHVLNKFRYHVEVVYIRKTAFQLTSTYPSWYTEKGGYIA